MIRPFPAIAAMMRRWTRAVVASDSGVAFGPPMRMTLRRLSGEHLVYPLD